MKDGRSHYVSTFAARTLSARTCACSDGANSRSSSPPCSRRSIEQHNDILSRRRLRSTSNTSLSFPHALAPSSSNRFEGSASRQRKLGSPSSLSQEFQYTLSTQHDAYHFAASTPPPGTSMATGHTASDDVLERRRPRCRNRGGYTVSTVWPSPRRLPRGARRDHRGWLRPVPAGGPPSST